MEPTRDPPEAGHVSRRACLTAMAGAAAAGLVRGAARLATPRQPAPDPPSRKLVVVLFGGGTRSSETIDDPEHRHVPRLWGEMVPRGTLFTNMRVEHKVVHPNCTGSILTGHWEWDDLDWTRPVASPTVFEVVRRARGLPDTAAWAFVYASILARAGESRHPAHGARFGANVVVPPTIPRPAAERMDRLMLAAAQSGSARSGVEAADQCARLARSTSRITTAGLRSRAAHAFLERHYGEWRSGSGTTSHDVFLTDGAIECLRTFAPDVLVVCFGEIDCAHYGSWSRYVEAIRRTDELTFRLWRATETMDDYRGRTLLLILPDHGRELATPGGSGFIHHSNFYTDEGADEGCRRVFMLALGPGVVSGRRVDEAVPTTAVAATGLQFLGLEAARTAAPSVLYRMT